MLLDECSVNDVMNINIDNDSDKIYDCDNSLNTTLQIEDKKSWVTCHIGSVF